MPETSSLSTSKGWNFFKIEKADVEGFLKVAYGKSRKKYRTSDYTIQKTDINIISTVVLIESNYKTEIFPSYNYVSQV